MSKSQWKLINWLIYLTLTMKITEGTTTTVDQEIRELLDMIPCDKIMKLCARYYREDPQVKSLMLYISGDQFKQKVSEIESSREFGQLTGLAKRYNIDASTLAKQFLSALDMIPRKLDELKPTDAENEDMNAYPRGVVGLLKEILYAIPMDDIKQSYRYKVRTNPQLKQFQQGLMKQIYSGEIKTHLRPIIHSKPMKEIMRDFKLMGLPCEEIKQIMEQTVTSFFDLGASVETEVQELLEMVPYDKVMEICIEYAISDQQVKSLLSYLCGEHFKKNIGEMQRSEEFQNMADAARVLNIDAYSLAHKLITALNSLPKRGSFQHPAVRRKRSPGDGLPGLVREAIEITPLKDIKEAYRYKLENNPELKIFEQSIMDRILSGEVKQYVEPVINSKPFQDTKKDLEALGIPLDQIQEFIELKLTEFFDLKQISANNNNNSTNVS